MRILIQNNLFLLPTLDQEKMRLFYAPKYSSQNQKAFFKKRFENLKKKYPAVKWTEDISDDDFDIALAWDALYEKRAFQNKLYPIQNRLFSSLPFPVPETFTPFRQMADKWLPSFYKDALAPWDDEVKGELDYYFRKKRLALSYLETRNELSGRDGSTKFSAFLSSGVLDVRYLYNEVRQFEQIHGATKSSGWIIFELLWREFFYWHYQKYQAHYFSKNGMKGKLSFERIYNPTREELAHITQEPFFHAALNELFSTGFLSNRARQIFASIWINDLKLDWRAGAQLFESELIDYDVYSNYGNWMYLTGVGVDPRGLRIFNVPKQLQTYDPQGNYLRQWSKKMLLR
jgi:deoxyribodipyrimidine photolyase